MIVLIISALARGDVDAGWPSAALVGAAIVAVAAAASVVYSGRWPVMGGRYSRATAGSARAGTERTGPSAAAASEAELWDAVDRGEDPTRDDPSKDE
jgi:uncharacterized membrane protein (TIGR02234 family)